MTRFEFPKNVDLGDDALQLLLDDFAYGLRLFSILAVEVCLDRRPSTQVTLSPVSRLTFSTVFHYVSP